MFADIQHVAKDITLGIIIPFATGNTPVCGWRFDPSDNISLYKNKNMFIFIYTGKNTIWKV